MDRREGMLVGVAYGDVLGSPCEFNIHKICNGIIHENWFHSRTNQYGFFVKHEIGQVTDDTEMTVACFQILLDGYTYENAIKIYHNFVNSGTTSLGSNTKKLFHGYKSPSLFEKRFSEQFSNYSSIEESQSNGHLMRQSPLSFIDDDDLRKTVVELDTMITNPSSISIRLSMFYVELLRTCHTSVETVDYLREYIQQLVKKESLNDIHSCFSDALATDFPRDVSEKRGWNIHSLSLALWVCIHCSTFQSSIMYVINCKGDTDTNASIAGALIGAIYGRQKIMEDDIVRNNWHKIIKCEPRITSGKTNALKINIRPPCYHPKQLFHLLQKEIRMPPTKNIDNDLENLKKQICKLSGKNVDGYILAITGSSCSGKSTLARKLRKEFKKNNKISDIVCQDNFKQPSKKFVNNKITWEGSDFTDWKRFSEDIKEKIKKNDILIVEGYLLYYLPYEIISLFTRTMYIDISIEECIKRRTTYPSKDRYGEKGWNTVEEYVKECIWPCNLEHEALVDFKNVIKLHKDQTVCNILEYFFDWKIKT